MKQTLIIVTFLLAGLLGGYLLFGTIGDSYLKISQLFSPAENVLEKTGTRVAGYSRIRQNILLSGLVGSVVGIAVTLGS